MIRDDSFFELAINEALTGVKLGHGGPFGAIIIKDGLIIASAHNEVVHQNDPTAHAEILAIRRAAASLKTFNLKGVKLLCTCEPCPMCLSAILWAGIDQLVYGCSSQDASSIGFNDKKIFNILKGTEETSIEIVSDFERDKCLDVFKLWQSKEDKILY